MSQNLTTEQVQEYYGKVLESSKDLKTTACCTDDAIPRYIKNILKDIHSEIMDKFYGCGSPIPLVLEGQTVLDLGCGTGRDVYLASALVGESGKVIGIDMTTEQLDVARKHVTYHQEKFGHSKSNVEFLQGYIEDLSAIPSGSVDVVISNCVINLSPDKPQVLKEVFRVLKPGGELYFSDVFSDRRVTESLRKDPILYGECLSGALYQEDFRREVQKLGCLDYRMVSKRKIDIQNEELEERVGNISFYSITVRVFKLDSLEDLCEDYGQVATYKGTIKESAHQYILDDHHTFQAGKPELVCGNTASMLEETRLGKHFTIVGKRDTHYGLFDCSGDSSTSGESDGAACC
jgi:ubiquinone/menaquinone biosynthesis C-methylase UbiE